MSRPDSVALVTGASRGIGRGVALALGAAGHHVLVNFKSSMGKAEEVVAEIRAAGGSAELLQGDVASGADVDRMAQEVEARFEQVDVLVNNAGVLRDGLLAMMSDAQWDEVLDTNLRGVFLTTRAFVKGMIRGRRGKVINMVSISGLIGTPGQANYAASKGGVIAMTRALAKELGRYKVQVNAVAPGFIETEMLTEMNPKQLAEMTKAIPLGRVGKVDEVAALVRFLASADNGYMTGQTLAIDGGLGV
ncbi:3-oxoacyl-ACP reductase FabG [Derxia gummosa]|uniref:3-oxoacyl-ACP reductase FabG n=1 Tax=Derxia gummosa DSM 723 TaxID=1121388 RepID=A0A8B6X669_9BURK|nr:3-oxoacyl-ACP reductase FabG [Derxia gummosa]